MPFYHNITKSNHHQSFIIYQIQTNKKYNHNQNSSMCIIGAKIILLAAKILELFDLVELVYLLTLLVVWDSKSNVFLPRFLITESTTVSSQLLNSPLLPLHLHHIFYLMCIIKFTTNLQFISSCIHPILYVLISHIQDHKYPFTVL